MTLGLLFGGLHRPNVASAHAQHGGQGAAWDGAYGPSWMRGSSGGWRDAIKGTAGGLQSTRAPGAATGWIGAPSWSNSNSKWRAYYASLEHAQPMAGSTGGHGGVLGGLLGGLLGGHGHGGGHGGGVSVRAPFTSVDVGGGGQGRGVSVRAPFVSLDLGRR